MARTSLLFFLAFALAVASAWATSPSPSASAVKTAKFYVPSTVGELKTFPFVEFNKLIRMKASMAPKTPEIGAMFSACDTYSSFMAGFAKRAEAAAASPGPLTAMFQKKLMATSHALMTAQMAFGAGGGASTTLMKSYEGVIRGFAMLPATVADICTNHKFNSAAKLSVAEQKEFTAVFGNLKKSIDAYFNTAFKMAAKKNVAVGGHSGGQMGNFFGAGAKAGFDASSAGKINVDGKKKKKKEQKKPQHGGRSLYAGENEFRSLNRPYMKHLVGMEA